MDFDFNQIPLVDPTRVGPDGRPLDYQVALDPRNNVAMFRDLSQGGRLVTLDLGPADVHYDRPLATYAVGYSLKNQYLIADKAMPVVMVDKASDLYYVWDKDDVFQAVNPTVSAAGGNIGEISPRQSRAPFYTLQYAIRTFLPTETEANADAALRLGMRYLQLPLDRLLLARELRVATAVTNPANYAAAYKQTLGATEKWNGGSASNPVQNLLDRIDAALRPITSIVMSARTYNAFTQNAQVQKYVASKTAVKPRPGVEAAAEWSALLELPPIIIGREKYKTSATAYGYIWGNNVALLTHPPEMPPMGTPISCNTFRWTGGLATGVNAQQAAMFGQVSVEQGWGVRTYYDPTRGAQGGKACVAFMQDAEVFVDDAVSGLIIDAYQP